MKNQIDRFMVYDPNTGEPAYRLNESLIYRQGVEDNLEDLKMVHQTKLDIFEVIRTTTDRDMLRSLAYDLTLCEYELQRLWGFDEDSKFHRFWEAPKCTCPRMDNEERYGTAYMIRNLSCPLHGTDT